MTIRPDLYDRPEYHDLVMFLRSQFDYNTANQYIQYFASFIDAATDPSSALSSCFVVRMLDVVEPTGGATSTTVGFQVEDFAGNPVQQELALQMFAWDDANCTAPAVNALLGGVVTGSIDFGNNSAAMIVRTNASGLFECTLSDLFDEPITVSCDRAARSAMLDCRQTKLVTFSA